MNLIDPDGLLPFGINAGEEYGDYASYYWAERSIQPDNTWYESAAYNTAGVFASLWTSCTSTDTAITLGTAGVGSGGVQGVRAAGYSVKLQRYPNAKGIGLNLYSKNSTHATKPSRRAIDWHQFKYPRKTGPIVNRPHIDRKYVPGKRNLRHWPWQ